MKIVWAYCLLEIKALSRNYSAAFFTLFFPAILLLLFGHQGNMDNTSKIATFIVFCNYAIQCVVFQYLGLNIAQQKTSDWSMYLKILPINHNLGYIGKGLAILLFALISVLIVVILVFFLSDISLTFFQYTWIIFTALIGGIPMIFLAIALGNLFNATAARGLFVLLNLALLFGAFSLPNHGIWQIINNIIPTFQWMKLGMSQVVSISLNKLSPWLWMIAFSIIFFIFMVCSHKKTINN